MRGTVVINGETMGSGSEELGRVLIGALLRRLAASPEKPERVVFYNSGVKLLAEGSPVLDAVGHLESSGVELIACGTCVEFFELKGKMKAGRTGSMDGIVADLLKAEKVVTI